MRPPPMRAAALVLATVALLVAAWVIPAAAQSPIQAPPAPATVAPDRADTLLDHPADTRWYVGGQVNLIYQRHGRFPSPYAGDNSLRPEPEHATSSVTTIYAGLELGAKTEVILHVESAGGAGLSGAVGAAGYPNYDVVRTPSLGAAPYLARFVVHHVIPLGGGTVPAERGELGLFTRLPARRLEFRLGKMSTVDVFDVNAGTGDSRRQFMNWTVGNNGAFDYAADTRGYTLAAAVEYTDRAWTVRALQALMPTTANGMTLDWDLRHAGGTNVEFEVRRGLVPGRPGTVRVLGFLNRARMGNYQEALDAFRRGVDPVPDITAQRQAGRRKYGAGVNIEQELVDGVVIFGRASWNNGRTESFAFTEVDRAGLVGVKTDGARWRREGDRVGVALSVNALSAPHQEYLASGGLGFIIGDGRLNYGRERILELFYTAALARGVFAALDLQYIVNPAYNRDRGPVVVPGIRLHVRF